MAYEPAGPAGKLRLRVYRALHGDGGGLTRTQWLLVVLILGSVLATVLATEPVVVHAAPQLFDALEWLFGAVFVLEYLARLWSIVERDGCRGLRGRLRYVVTPVALIDLVALLPFLLGMVGAEVLVLRMVRLLRLLALAKMLRYSRTAALVVQVIWERRFELGFTMIIALTFILVSAAALYWVEGDSQPEVFGSVPRAMWWAVATLSTVGYGDVVPITALGRTLAAMTAIAGIGLIAAPTGILAAALSDALAKARSVADRNQGADSQSG